MDSSADGPPPLEDMSELLQQVTAIRDKRTKQQTQTHLNQNGHSHTSGHTQNGVGHTSNGVDKTRLVDSSENKTSKTDNGNKSSTEPKQNTSTTTNKSESKASGTKGSFGGMKKGFLFGGPPKNASNSSTKKPVSNKSDTKKENKTLEDIPFITKKETDTKDSLKFSEVQEAMEKTNSKLMQNKDWVTDDLLEKIEKNDKLAKKLQNPMFLQAINEFQTNPQGAMKKYGSNPEVQEFFTEFCGLMGQHFNKLADKQGPQNSASSASQSVITKQTDSADISVRSSTNPRQPTASDERKMQEILSNQDVRDVLMDPKVQELFECLRNDPQKGQRLLQTAPPDFKFKIQKLVNAGLLQFQ